MKINLNFYLREGWKVQKTNISKTNVGEKHHTINRLKHKPYMVGCHYALPGFIYQEIVLTLNRRGFVKSEKEIIRAKVEYWPYCPLPQTFHYSSSDWIEPNWTEAIQLELLYLL